jgi:hypothetical protein
LPLIAIDMIKKNTVLVLGAGASMGFGYPSGAGLRDHLISGLGNENDQPHGLLSEMGFPKDDIARFRLALNRSGTLSVDAFLEQRREFVAIGKAAIASHLLRCESATEMVHSGSSAKWNWYLHLWSRMTNEGDFNALSKNRVSVLTFNYDRSFEQFLFNVASNLYGRDPVETTQALSAIPVIHLHGSLGPLIWQKPDGSEYGCVPTVERVKLAAETIKIVHEAVDGDAEFQQAKILLSEAELILFLGFAYAPRNLERLCRGVTVRNCRACGTAFSLPPKQAMEICRRFQTEYSIPFSIGRRDQEVLGFLEQDITFE